MAQATTNYQIAKSNLKAQAKQLKAQGFYKTDKPMVRQCLNDYADSLSRDYDFSDYQKNNLSSFVCTLHPKSKN